MMMASLRRPGDDPAVQAWDVSVDVQRSWWDTLVSGVTHAVSYVESWWPFGQGSSHGGDGLDAVAAGHAGLKWAWVGNEISIQLTGFTRGNRVWAYLVVPDEGAGAPSSCVTTDVSTVFVAVGDVSGDGNSPVFKVPVSLDTFSLGENYVCAVGRHRQEAGCAANLLRAEAARHLPHGTDAERC